MIKIIFPQEGSPIRHRFHINTCQGGWNRKGRKQLLGLANERFREVDQVKFTYADMHGNIKVMLRYPVQRKYVLQIQSENDITNILSRLHSEYECFDEIYPSDGT